MQWVRFKDRFPQRDDGNELLCAVEGGQPFMYHWFIDSAGYTELATFYWLDGVKLPPVPRTGHCGQNGHQRGSH